MVELLLADDEPEVTHTPEIAAEVASPDKVADVIARYFAESEVGHKANVSTLGAMLMKQFPGISENWAGYPTLSQLLRRGCLLKVGQVENRTLAWKE
jgi:hypothetical protein